MNEQFKNHDDRKFDVFYIRELLQTAYSDARDAYGAISNYEDDMKYHISLNYLNLSFQSYLAAKTFYYSHEEIQHFEFDDFFNRYEHFKDQLKQVITKKDQNTSWLYSAYEDLKQSMTELNQFIDNAFKSTL